RELERHLDIWRATATHGCGQSVVDGLARGDRGSGRLLSARREVRLTLCVYRRVGKAWVAMRASACGELVPDLSRRFRLRLRGLAAGGECADDDHAECDRRSVGEIHSAASVWPVSRRRITCGGDFRATKWRDC